jgi:RecB family endonuclease NucS
MIVLGADTHKRSHTIAAVGAASGELLGEQTVQSGAQGAAALLRWARGLGDDGRVWALEDCRHVSGSLERFLIARGERVLRVHSTLMSASRRQARGRGKSESPGRRCAKARRKGQPLHHRERRALPHRRSRHRRRKGCDPLRRPSAGTLDNFGAVMRLIVARCTVDYTGRISTRLAEATRLLMIKADGTFMIWDDGAGSGGHKVKPLNWMTPPTVIDEEEGRIVVRKRTGDDQLEIALSEVLSDVTHAMDFDAARLEKDGVEADLQVALAAAPECCGEGFRLVRREWPTDIGPVDLMCRDDQDGWTAVEIKRVGTIDAVEQLCRYLERIRLDPALGDCRGVLAAQVVKPQARVLAEARGLAWVEIDLAELRGERAPALTLFG